MQAPNYFGYSPIHEINNHFSHNQLQLGKILSKASKTSNNAELLLW